MAISAPVASSTLGLKNFVVCPLIDGTDTEFVAPQYGEVHNLSGAVEASITPENADPDIQYADDIEFDKAYKDPKATFKMKLADLPVDIQALLLDNHFDANGVLVRTANDKPKYFACGFKSIKSNGKYRFVWLYKCYAKPITENYATKEGENVTRQNGEVEFTAIKRTFDAKWQVIADEDKGTVPGTFLSTVYETKYAAASTLTALSMTDDSTPGTSISLTPAFDANNGVFAYTATTDEDGIKVTATAGTDCNVTIFANDVAVESGEVIAIADGKNYVSVKCVDKDGHVSSYIIEVTKTA